VRHLGVPPSEPVRLARWLREVSIVSAYRDRWHIEGQRPLGAEPNPDNLEETTQRKRALAAAERAQPLTTGAMDPPINTWVEPAVEQRQSIEL
jgi:hypothetical protein